MADATMPYYAADWRQPSALIVGNEANGIGEETLAALNGGAFERARTLAVNLERRRWLVRQPPATRIDVNTGGAVLAYWRDGQLANQRRVVVGQRVLRKGKPIGYRNSK